MNRVNPDATPRCAAAKPPVNPNLTLPVNPHPPTFRHTLSPTGLRWASTLSLSLPLSRTHGWGVGSSSLADVEEIERAREVKSEPGPLLECYKCSPSGVTA